MTSEEGVFEDACQLARSLFNAYIATLVIKHDSGYWRSHDPNGDLPRSFTLSAGVITSGKPLWVENLAADPLSQSLPLVTGKPGFRFYAAAPVILADGTVLGALCVIGLKPKKKDARKLADLERLARLIADECERARTAEALARGARQLEDTRGALATFCKAVPLALIMTDREMRIIEASPQWLADLQVADRDVRGVCLYDMWPGYFDRFRESYDRCLAGEVLKFDRVRIENIDGSQHYMQTALTPWYDSAGEVGGLISVAVDINDMVQALKRSERSEQRLKMAIELAALHVWEIDYTTGQVETYGMESDFLDEPVDLVEFAKDTNITMDPRDRERLAEPWKHAVLNDLPFTPEWRLNRKDGKEVWATGSSKLVRSSKGTPLRLIGAMQNITERKAAEQALLMAKEEAENANRAKSAFLATMSHEIRTPLNGVLGMAQAMAQDELTETQRQRLDTVRQSGETLLAILNDVLDLSKIEAGKLEQEIVDFPLSDLARGAHAAFSALALKKGLAFNLVVDEAAKGIYRGDSTRLRQILYNLVSNAVKFTDTGEVRVSVTRDGGDLVLVVKDTGIGIPDEMLPMLFRKFEQADASTTRRYGGTGLGLAICRELAELLGGFITASSGQGDGATFTVRLPFERVGEERDFHAAQSDRPAGEMADLGALRVLAAEDNSVNQLVLRTLLQQAGVEPHIVNDGAEALAAWRGGRWDIILMDVQMPVMDGPTAARAIRADEQALNLVRTPIIALTANAMAHQVAEYIEAGMNGFVAKPIQVEALFAAMETALEPAVIDDDQRAAG